MGYSPWGLKELDTTERLDFLSFFSFFFIFWTSKSLWAVDCSHEIKKHLLLGRKTMTKLDSILKNRHITLQTKVHIVKAMVFFSSHVWM